MIVFENGKSGFMGEHSCMDGTPTLRLNEFALAALAARKINLGPPRTSETGKGLPPPTELKFVVNETINKHVEDAEVAFDNLIGQHDMQVSAVLRVLYSDSHSHVRFYITRVMESSMSRNSRRLLTPGFSS